MIEIMHRSKGHVAFLYEGPLTGKIQSARARELSGHQPVPHTQVVCGACGQRLTVADLEVGAESDLAFFEASEN